MRLAHHCPQTAAFAEHAAAVQIPNLAEKGMTVYSDCSSVLTSWQGGPMVATDPKRQIAGLWLEFNHTDYEYKKTKAHRRASEVDIQDMPIFLGNQQAELLAKDAASSVLSLAELEQTELYHEACRRLLLSATRAM